MKIESRHQIIKHRLEIEREIAKLLIETGSDFGLEDVQAAIYDEEESDDLMKVVAMFDEGGDVSELENILELATEAWNYFPHKTLGNLSPAEMVLESRGHSFS